MARDYYIFVRNLDKFEPLLKALQELLSARFTRESTDMGEIYRLIILEQEICVLPDHDLVDDAGIPFSEYPFEIAFALLRSKVDQATHFNFRKSLVFFIAEYIERNLFCETIIVDDLQKIIR